MTAERPSPDFYVTGGTMSPDADSYVERPADKELFHAVEAGEFCYVLTTRQMGKSSLMARTARRLAAAGVRSAQITLETIRESSEAPSPDQFLYGVARRIHKELGLSTKLLDWWQERDRLSATQRFHEYLTEFLIDSVPTPIVVFIDEIDSTIGLPFADDFYATIRACYNGRASKPELKRLTFVLLGVATPAQLITDPTRTPFNIGKGIELTDFTATEAWPLARAFSGTAAEQLALLERVLYWTGGHPYLTQTLCRAIATRTPAAVGVGGAAVTEVQPLVDAEVDRLFLRSEAREEYNLKFVRSRLTQGHSDLRSVLRTYQNVLVGKVVEDKPASSVHASLKLAGVVRANAEGHLQVRNRIYERVFGPEWVRRELPRDRARFIASAAMVVLLVGGGFSVSLLQDANRRRQILQEENRLQVLKIGLLEHLYDFVGLAALASEHEYDWSRIPGGLPTDFVDRIDGGVFASGPWQEPNLDPKQLLDVIERGHRLFVPSRSLFGAMTFALEEVYLRFTDAKVRERARALSETVRAAFITYHKEKSPNFKEPPARTADDTLNVWVPLNAGEFVMGSKAGYDDERPPHTVHVSAFSMQQHEVTNEEYRRFDPAYEFRAGQERHPVADVVWYEAAGYAAWLGASLPTEAEWEYAARGTGEEPPVGKKGRRYPWGFEPPTAKRAVYGSQGSGTQPVGSRGRPGRTPEGLDDMAGNVWEWCRDWYGPYAARSISDPWGPTARDAEGELRQRERVVRGGSFRDRGVDLSAASRLRWIPVYRPGAVGFRVVSSRLRP